MPCPRCRRIHILAALAVLAWAGSGRGDQFEQLDGPLLVRMLRGEDVTPRAALTVGEVGAMPARLRDTRSALVLARTDRGNPARLLVVPELRKPATGEGDAFPVMVIERLDSFDAADPAARLASRRDVVLYDGFQLDLESGQVVPEGQGGDLAFRVGGEAGPRLEPLGVAKIFSLSKNPAIDASRGPQPTPGRAVVAADFAGRYRLFANGQWSGTLDLRVEGRGVVVGRFRSDLHGSSYPVTGQVTAETPQQVRFSISFPRARQEFDAYLWGEGKGAMAGTVSLLERTFGFFAVREGGRYAPEGRDLGPLPRPGGEGDTDADADRPGRHVVDLGRDGSVALDEKPSSIEAVGTAFKALAGAEADPAPWAQFRVDPDLPYRDLRKALDAVEASGVRFIRLGPAK